MKDEIKEILDDLKYTAKKHTIQVLENGGKIEHCSQEIETELRLNTYSVNILLDYITNLQEENERLKQFYDKKGVYSLEYNKETLSTMICELQEENENLIEEINNIIRIEITKKELQERIEKTRKHIQHELSHLKANDEVSWNEEFYTNNKLDYKKLCIALLEQVLIILQGVSNDV